MTAALKLLSAGAVKRGVASIAAQFDRATGNTTEVTFMSVPEMRKHVAAGGTADVLVATPAAMDEFAAQSKIVAASRAYLGRSRMGVVVHKDAALPDLADTEAFKRTLLAASAVVYNTASSGVYVEQLLDKLGIKPALASKIAVVNSGAAVMEAVAARPPGAVGLGQISEAMVLINKGCAIKLAAPLPDTVQNITTYHVAAVAGGTAPEAAAALAQALTSVEAKQVFATTGID